MDLNNEQACVFSRSGELLWQSPGWFPDHVVPEAARRLHGKYWHELVHEDDLPGVLAFFADGREGAITFRCMMATTGGWALWTQYKIPYGEHWLTFGEYSEIALILPAPPCVFYDENEEQTG